MDKNTIIAIVLATITVIVAIVLQPIIFPANNTAQTQSVETSAEEKKGEEVVVEEVGSQAFKEVKTVEDKNLKEETVEVNTGKAKFILSNKGASVISCKLTGLKKADITDDDVEMVDNVSDENSAYAISLGKASDSIINDLFSITSDETEKKTVTKKDGTTEEKEIRTVVFSRNLNITNNDGSVSKVRIAKRYTFVEGEYLFRLEVRFEDSAKKGLLKDITYAIRTSPQVGPYYDKSNRYDYRQFLIYNGKKTKSINISPNRALKEYNTKDSYVWAGIGSKYFASLILPADSASMGKVSYSTEIEKDDYSNAQAVLTRNNLGEVNSVTDTYYCYVGPREEKTLKVYNTKDSNYFGLEGTRLIDCLLTNGWLGWLETLLKILMELINKVVHNWGVSIIVLTILIKMIMFPFTRKQSLSTLKMQEIQPRMKEIQEKYAGNPQKQNEAMAKLYKETGYNPMSGCLPLLVQFFILFAMYKLFNTYYEFYQASFIPGWIDDLSKGDCVHQFTHSIWFFGDTLRILPVIYLASQLFYGKITGNGGTATTGNQTQMKIMMYGMPILFFFIFYSAPSGLLIYWTVSNVFQMVQQIIINRTMNKKRAEMAGKTPAKKGSKK